MSGPLFGSDLAVGRVVARGFRPDNVDLRRRAEALLLGEAEAASALGAAILCVRSITARLPAARITARRGAMNRRPGFGAGFAAIARTASRPALAPVPPGAGAVLFADRAELLACLARDWLDGVGGTRWWWQALFRNQDPTAMIRFAWAEAPEFMPAAMALLAADGLAVRFSRALDPQVVAQLLDTVTRTYGLGTFRQALAAADRAPAEQLGRHDAGGPASVAHPAGIASSGLVATTVKFSPGPISRWVPEALSEALAPRQRALLAVTLALARVPAEARSHGFAASLLHWMQEIETATTSTTSSCTAPSALPGSSATPSPVAPTPDATGRRLPTTADGVLSPDQGARPETPGSLSAGTQSRPGGAETGARSPAPLPVTAALTPDLARASRPGRRPAGDRAERADLPANGLAPGATDSIPLPPGAVAALIGRSIETRHGGLFCLLNAAIALGLYGDFTTPDEPGIALSPWDFLALAGEGLAGPGICRDPVWALLAQLAGRDETTCPGQDFVPPNDWRMPPDWLVPFGDTRTTWSWQIEETRLAIRHPAGFVVLDVARDASAANAQVRREARAYRDRLRFRLRQSPELRADVQAAPLERWLGWLMPYLAQRLVAGLGISTPRRAARQLLRRPARIEIGAARLDVHLRLADLPIEVRLAGLDRDPGWIPAAGRFVAFHYD